MRECENVRALAFLARRSLSKRAAKVSLAHRILSKRAAKVSLARRILSKRAAKVSLARRSLSKRAAKVRASAFLHHIPDGVSRMPALSIICFHQHITDESE